ncbi:activin receptor type-1-like [Arapaima gigas]
MLFAQVTRPHSTHSHNCRAVRMGKERCNLVKVTATHRRGDTCGTQRGAARAFPPDGTRRDSRGERDREAAEVGGTRRNGNAGRGAGNARRKSAAGLSPASAERSGYFTGNCFQTVFICHAGRAGCMGWNNAGAGGDGSALSGRPREDRVTAPVIAKQAVPRSETDAFKSEQESGTQAGRVDTPEQPFLSEEPSGARLVLPTVCVAAQADLQGELGPVIISQQPAPCFLSPILSNDMWRLGLQARIACMAVMAVECPSHYV